VRLIGVVDHETDPTDFEECIWTLLNNIDPERDLEVVNYRTGPVSVLDGTPKLASEGFDRPWPDKIVMTDEGKKRVDERFGDMFHEPEALRAPEAGNVR
jgi:4-hydroxy-3-polyprenylbenzoate decarboxylase